MTPDRWERELYLSEFAQYHLPSSFLFDATAFLCSFFFFHFYVLKTVIHLHKFRKGSPSSLGSRKNKVPAPDNHWPVTEVMKQRPGVLISERTRLQIISRVNCI